MSLYRREFITLHTTGLPLGLLRASAVLPSARTQLSLEWTSRVCFVFIASSLYSGFSNVSGIEEEDFWESWHSFALCRCQPFSVGCEHLSSVMHEPDTGDVSSFF